jgi:hypothetical protein
MLAADDNYEEKDGIDGFGPLSPPNILRMLD